MSPQVRLWSTVLLHFVVFGRVLLHNGDKNMYSRDESGYRDHSRLHKFSVPLQDNRALLVTHQKGSAVIPHVGSTVKVIPKEVSYKLYRGHIKATILDRPNRKGRHDHRLRHGESERGQRWNSQNQPLALRQKAQVCVRCPRDKTFLAHKGSVSANMETPPVIPCYAWSSVEGVESEVFVGPQSGTRMAEGSHKVVLHLFQHKRTLATCVIRYNVIVRKCPKLEPSPGVRMNCPMDRVWGSHCNFTCGFGYMLEGDSSTECSDDLEWTGVMPQCVASRACPSPVTPEYGHFSCRTPQHVPISLQGSPMLPEGTMCHFRCQPGYVVPPALTQTTRMRCSGGAWDTDQDPICVETNDLEQGDEQIPPDISVDDALSLDGKNCPENYCLNRGKCLTILNEPMCSCRSGYYGLHCEVEDSDSSTDPNNTVT